MAKPLTLAEELFEKIKSSPDAAAFLKAMADPASQTFESDYLDFKVKPNRDDELKEIWYRALSGFANSGGGVLIWGIDARPDPATGIDVACGVKPIPDPDKFKSLLIELQRGATDPPLGDVRIEVWESSPGEGFMACLIPSGPFKPYRAEIAGKKQFYMRAGDKFFVPNVAILRALFSPEPRAVFQLHARLTVRPDSDFSAFNPEEQILTECELEVENVGMGTARAPYIVIDIPPEPRHERIRQMPGWESGFWRHGKWITDSSRPVHPGCKVPMVTFAWLSPATAPFNAAVSMYFALYAEHQPRQVAEIEFRSKPFSGRAEYSKSVIASES
jgi:hypothetical protein